jgi:ABC-2 type transport system ATP-binding protein
MIQIEHLDKAFDGYKAVDDVSLTIHGAQVFGLVGTNGAGKSTILRLVSGILKPDKGSILVDGKSVYDRPETKKNIFFIMDDPYFFPNSLAKNPPLFCLFSHLNSSSRLICGVFITVLRSRWIFNIS